MACIQASMSSMFAKIESLPLIRGNVPLIATAALLYFALVALSTAVGILRFMWVYFLRPGKNLKRSLGSWAVVTGATDGIGRAYSEQLARQGLNLVLISRTQSRLEQAAKEIREAYGVQVRIIPVDLTKLNSADALQPILEALKGLEVGLLVNNAGMSYDHPEYLEAFGVDGDVDLITINTIAPSLLCKAVLPGMKSRRRGAIVNLGSANGLLPAVPLLSTYAGSKSFINQFTRSLDAELRQFSIRVQDQCPMFVATKMSKIRRARLDAPSPKVWAKAAVRQIGYDTVRTPYWYHGLMMAVVQNMLPAWAVTGYVLNLHRGFRTKYYRKQARQSVDGTPADAKKVI